MTELEQAPRKAHGLRWLWLTAAAIFTATTVSACVLTPAQLGLTGQDNSSPTSTPSGTTDQLADKLPEQLLSTEQPSSAPKSGAAKTTTKKAPTVTVGEKLEFGRGVFNPTDPNFKLFNPLHGDRRKAVGQRRPGGERRSQPRQQRPHPSCLYAADTGFQHADAQVPHHAGKQP
ncbi:MAG: hypothetical protein Q4A82_02070 [Corynebacterium sp.]|nr:hypothetical protein [Corynebacterium sp.]